MLWTDGGSGYGGVSALARGSGELPAERDRAEELANSVAHGVGLALSLGGLYGLVVITRASGVPGLAAGCAVYGASLVVLYAASTLFHGWPDDRVRPVLLLLDHIGIYILIAGTYTPVALIPLRGPTGWTLLVLAWGFALVGSAVKIGRIRHLSEDSPVPYLAMSGMWLAAAGQIIATVPPDEILWLIGGSVAYAAGLAFFINDGRRFNHTIWHLCVLAGSICHYRMVIGCAITMAK
jgi:hemolysin III